MISLEAGFVFIHRGKSAGNSITELLLPHAPDNAKRLLAHKDQNGIDQFDIAHESLDTRKHASLREYEAAIGREKLGRLYKFSNLRNPFDRLVSVYFHPPRIERRGRDFIEADFIKIINKQRTFRDFVCLEPGDALDTHLDRIIRFEHLEEDLNGVMDDLGLPRARLPHRNRSDHDHYRSYYSPATRALVEERFAEELAFGSYSF